MKLNFNRHMLNKTIWDSGSISPLAAVVHDFREIGRYQGMVLRETETVSQFSLTVDDKYPEASINIDAGAINHSAFIVSPRSHTVFQAPRDGGGYSVVVNKQDDGRKKTVFDNRELQSGDMFVTSLMRPGRYIVTDQAGTKGDITVTPPGKERICRISRPLKGFMRYIAPEALTIEHTEKGFKPDNIKTESGQPLIFMVKRLRARIKIQFEGTSGEPDDPCQRRSPGKEVY